jgi:hypothetical protein
MAQASTFQIIINFYNNNNNNEARGHGLSLNCYNNDNNEARDHVMARASIFQIIMRLES